jgi:hypothetical protein
MIITRAQKVEYLKQNYKDLDKVALPYISPGQYEEIKSVLFSSGWYKCTVIDKSTIDRLVSEAKGVRTKNKNVKGKHFSVDF